MRIIYLEWSTLNFSLQKQFIMEQKGDEKKRTLSTIRVIICFNWYQFSELKLWEKISRQWRELILRWWESKIERVQVVIYKTALEKSNFTFLTCLFFQTNTGLGPNITGSDETINEYMKDRVRFTKNEACFSRYLYVYQLTVFTSCYTFHLCFLASLDVKCAGAVQVLLEKIID